VPLGTKCDVFFIFHPLHCVPDGTQAGDNYIFLPTFCA